MEDLIHKRDLTKINETLCGSKGAKIYLSDRVTCPECRMLMSVTIPPEKK